MVILGHFPLCVSKNGPAPDINIRATAVHMLGQIIQNIGALALIEIDAEATTDRYLFPIMYFVTNILIFLTTLPLVLVIFDVLMETVPNSIDPTLLRKQIAEIKGVGMVNDLHVWRITEGRIYFSCHIYLKSAHAPPSENETEVLMEDGTETEKNRVKATYAKVLDILKNYEIMHHTVQIM